MSGKHLIAALDQGTMSSRCLIFDERAHLVSVAQQDIERTFLHPGWVQQDATEIWASQMSVFAKALAQIQISAQDLAGIGITNQRETTIVWDKRTGAPIYDALVWQCRRSAPLIDEALQRYDAATITHKTGLIPDSYFSASKIAWILREVPGAREKARRGDLLFGTVDTWLIWKLTGGEVHATDQTNASRTMLFNIHELDWDEELLQLFDIPRSLLPEVKPSRSYFGNLNDPVLGGGTPILGVAGDQQSALFGQRCFQAGEAKNTYGTGCFLLMNTGVKPVQSHHGLLTTIAYSDEYRTTYALEGSVFNAGSAIKWLADGLQLIRTAEESEKMALSVPDAGGCFVVPAFNGLGAPYWKSDARGAIFGLTQGVTRAHVVRATLESLAFQTADVLRAMEKDAETTLTSLQVDGGVSANNFCMQFQADILDRAVNRPHNTESTALGAAFIAGLGAGVWDSLDELRNLDSKHDQFRPNIGEAERTSLLAGWADAVARVLA